jgi:RNA polymerase-binding transcription factor DksA
VTAPTPASGRAGSAGRSLSILQLAALRATLVGDRRQETARLMKHAATFAGLTHSSEVTASKDRAMAALHMYGARREIEQIEDAVVRIDEGAYGMCLSCNEEMSFARLQARPQSRTCAECSRRGCRNSADAPVGKRGGLNR